MPVPAEARPDRRSAPLPRPGRGKRRSVIAQPCGPERVFVRDPEFRKALLELPASGRRAVARLAVSSWRLAPGRWEPEENPPLREQDCGYYVVEGVLLRRVHVGSRCSAELLGAGDIFRPDDAEDSLASVASRCSHRVLAPARIAVVECGVAAVVESLPGVAAIFQRRVTRRAHSLRMRLAIVQEPQLAKRLELLLGHLADRFGYPTPEGTLIPFPLSHEVLAESCSVQRPSVVTAIHRLESRGAVERTEEGGWLLRSGPEPEAI